MLKHCEDPAVEGHANDDHDDHHGDDLCDIGEISAHVQEESQAAALGEQDQFSAQQRAPGEGEALTQCAGERGK